MGVIFLRFLGVTLTVFSKERKQYKGVHNREIRTLFNIDQTTLPYVDKEGYEEAVRQDGSIVERGYTEADERRLRGRFNDFLTKMRDNLVPVRSDGSGMPHYETDRDAVYMPRQRDFEHYNDYVQEALRQVVSATGHQQRLAREGMVMKNGVAPSEDAVKQERIIGKTKCAGIQNQMRLFGGRISPKRKATKISHTHKKHRSSGNRKPFERCSASDRIDAASASLA